MAASNDCVQGKHQKCNGYGCSCKCHDDNDDDISHVDLSNTCSDDSDDGDSSDD